MTGLSRLPTSFPCGDLQLFTGWRTWDDLRATRFADVPSGPAVYLVYRCSTALPEFLRSSPGGHFKGRDPTVSVDVLESQWVAGAQVLYIGQSTRGARRLREFARFGAGEPVGHWGGRLIWQLGDSDQLLVAWHGITWDETARAYEKRLLNHFRALHDSKLPFANLRE